MNKNMTSGEGGAVVTNDMRLYCRSVACYDLGFARDEAAACGSTRSGHLPVGHGHRLDEMRAAILRVQLRKLPRIIAHAAQQYRICGARPFPQVTLREIQDPDGDTGCFLITTYPDAATARREPCLKAEGIGTYPQGISNILMTGGVRSYYNIASLVGKTSIDGRFPWRLAENAERPEV
jgi:8-amino-3,8-dideoxy-alpha-D-manno-octulosonate transaminase